MFVLNKEQLEEFDLRNAKQFVTFWSSKNYYKSPKVFNKNEDISYFEELNLGKRLTEENVKRLLRWKDARRLTEKIQSGPKKGERNEKVIRVINELKSINEFRLGEITEEKYKEVTNNIFPNGIVWQVFLFHMARPFEYPIADRNVFRAYAVQRRTEIPEDWATYKNYVDYFFDISIHARLIDRRPTGNEGDIREIVSCLKKVDDALFVFGQFLNTYG
jgi:hypothetical protein